MILFPGLLKGHHQTELPELPLDLVVFFNKSSRYPVECKLLSARLFISSVWSEKHKTKYLKGMRLCAHRLYHGCSHAQAHLHT